MRVVSPDTAEQIAINNLRLDSDAVDFTTIEALAALLRRCGAFRCPCPPSTLIRASMALLHGIRDDTQSRGLLSDVLEQAVSYGDFIECREITGHSNARLLYIAPPSFVELSSGRFLIFGIAVDDNLIVPPDLAHNIEYSRHARLIQSVDRNQTRLSLLSSGVIEIAVDYWLKAPTPTSAGDHYQKYAAALETCSRPGIVDDLIILDSDTPVHFYNGRWIKVKRQTGAFVARRPQIYGAPLWAYVELVDGTLTRLLDFPMYENKWRACDEAWHLQLAIDATRGLPQVYRLRCGAHSTHGVLELFSPIPSWVQRRWDYVGEPVPSSGSLLAYRFDLGVIDAELQFASERIWLAERR